MTGQPGEPEPAEPPADPAVHVLRIRLPEQPGAELYALARQSLADRVIRGAADMGQAGEVTDLGPDALDVANSISPDDIAPGKLLHVGVAKNGRWVQWLVPGVPPEPVPGSRGQRGQRN